MSKDHQTDILYAGLGAAQDIPLQEPMASYQFDFFSGKESVFVYFILPYDILDKPDEEWDSLKETMMHLEGSIRCVIKEKRNGGK